VPETERGPGGGEFGGVRPQFGVGEDDTDAGVVEDVQYLGGLEEIVDGHGDGPGLKDGVKRGNKFRAVLQPQSDAVAGLDAVIAF
jgi:hypothetical protein